ncbi:MAG: hypothetical protein SOY73_00605 [Blautia sp.]|nr:hypothetical protein [Blautia sp.]MDY3997611.1 hypothetical protein [Blautia sp.]
MKKRVREKEKYRELIEIGIRAACITVFIILMVITKNEVLLVWGVTLLLQEIFLVRVNEMCKSQDKIFPEESYRHPKYFLFLFRHARLGTTRVPKLVIVEMYITILMSILADILLLMITLNGIFSGEIHRELLWTVLTMWALLDILFFMFFDVQASVVCFLYKFKRITKSNMKYMIARTILMDQSEKEPSAVFLGKCIILSKQRRGKVAKVEMINEKKVLEKALLVRNRTYQEGEVYGLFEICGVKYID